MRRFFTLAVLSLLALGAWAWSSGSVLAPPQPGGLVLDDSSMCGDPYYLRWEPVPGAAFYDVEYIGGAKGDAGLFCRATHPFDAGACDCDRYAGDDFPAGCLDGAAMVTATSNTITLAVAGWSVHYRVRAVDTHGTQGPWSEIAMAGCWID